jgi:hypothetical protein
MRRSVIPAHARLAAVLALLTIAACSTDDPVTTTDAGEGSDSTTTDTTPPTDASTDDGTTDALPPLPTPGIRDLGWIQVEDGRLVDEFGREWLVRGINARVEGLFDVTFDDGRIPLQPIPDFNADDASAAVAMGFNMLRLPINWSGLEPTEGEFSEVYLQRLDEVVTLATAAGLYVLIDFHQDAYSKEIGEDGAPLWAIEPPPTQLLQGPLTDLAQRRVSAQVLAAFAGFFRNDLDLQNRFMPVFELVVRRYADRAGVIGIEVMNEPVASGVPNGDEALYDFYELAVSTMRAAGSRHTVWLEPDAQRNFSQTAPIRSEPFPDDQVVYCPHFYPGLVGITADSVEGWKTRLTQTFDDLILETGSWGGALVVGEWGVDPLDPESVLYWEAVDQLSDERLFGHIYWLWKERSQGSWGFYTWLEEGERWEPRVDAIAQFSRAAVMAVPGRLVSHRSRREDGVLTATFQADGSEAAPLVYLPEGSWTATLNGEPIELQRDAATGRALVPWQGQSGQFELVITPAQ